MFAFDWWQQPVAGGDASLIFVMLARKWILENLSESS
jgi:hypothetical protein